MYNFLYIYIMDKMLLGRQIQEKSKEQHKDLYMVFIDLTKAFDSINRTGLWSLRKIWLSI